VTVINIAGDTVDLIGKKWQEIGGGIWRTFINCTFSQIVIGREEYPT
jgi:hypothetical protein